MNATIKTVKLLTLELSEDEVRDLRGALEFLVNDNRAGVVTYELLEALESD